MAINPTALKSDLRKAKARIVTRKNDKLNKIAKKKKEIKAYLEVSNETMALVHAEPLINDERMLPCYDVLSSMCDTLMERVPMLVKTGKEVPADMKETLHTLAYASSRAGVEELVSFTAQIGKMYGSKFLKQSETDEKCIHKLIRENINLISPEEGWKVERLMEVAKEDGIQYTPTERTLASFRSYSAKKAGSMGGPSVPPGPGSIPGIGGMSNVPGQMPYQPTMPQPILPGGLYNNQPNPYQPPAPHAVPGYPQNMQPQMPNQLPTQMAREMPPQSNSPSLYPQNFQQPNYPPPAQSYNPPPQNQPPQNQPPQAYAFNPPPVNPAPANSQQPDFKLDPTYTSNVVEITYPSVSPMPGSAIPPPPPTGGMATGGLPGASEPKPSQIDDFEARLANLKK